MKINKFLKVLLIILIVLSPYIVGLIKYTYFNDNTYKGYEDVSALLALIIIIFGIPAIAVVGCVTAIIRNLLKKTPAFLIIAFLIPAILVDILVLL